MKTKTFKLSILFMVVSLICGLGLYLQPKKVEAYAAEQTTNISQYMKVDGEDRAYKSTENAGFTEGYGRMVLNATDVVLTSTPNRGFKIVAWNIVYENEYEPGKTERYQTIGNSEISLDDGKIVINPVDANTGAATLKVTTVFEDLKIEPVFDYVLYNVYVQNLETGVSELQGQYNYKGVVNIDYTVPGTLNVDVNGVIVNGESLANNEYTITDDPTTGRTIGYSINFTMSNFEDKEITFNYDYLYKANLSLYLDDVDVTSNAEVKEQLLKAVMIVNRFAKLDDLTYLVKSGVGFQIVCNENYTENGYMYYEFNALDGGSAKYKTYSTISSDFTIEIKYISTTYDIVFRSAIYETTKDNLGNVVSGKISQEVTGVIVLPDNIALTRLAPIEVLDSSILKENIGYAFEGFVLTTGNKILSNADKTMNVDINDTNPQNIIVYVCYSKVQYSVKLVNFNSVSLTDLTPSTVYAIDTFTLNEETRTNETLRDTANNGNIFKSFEINDEFTVDAVVNFGFNIHGYSFTAGLDLADVTNEKTFKLTKSLLSTVGADNIINLYVYESIKDYTLIYKIDPTNNGTNDVIMAAISIENPASYDVETTTQEVNGSTEVVQIKINGLNLYQSVKIKSMPYQTAGGSDYLFVKYTKDGKDRLLSTVEDVYNVWTETLTEDIDIITITAVYSVPQTKLEITTNAPTGAITGITVNPYIADGDDTDLEYVISTNNPITVNFTKTEVFGYAFVGYILSYGGTDYPLETDATTYTFTALTEQTYHLTINYRVLEYRIIVDTEDTKDDDNVNLFSKQVSVLDSKIEFTKPSGVYVNSVKIKVKNNNVYDEYTKMIQTNESRNGGEQFGKFIYEIDQASATNEELQALVNYYGDDADFDNHPDTIRVVVGYDYYRYEVVVKHTDLAVTATSPTIELHYIPTGSVEPIKADFIYNAINNEVTYNNIPYGSYVELNVTKGVSAGYEMLGWYEYSNPERSISKYVTPYTERKLIILGSEMYQDQKMYYRVDKIDYTLKLDFENSQGTASFYDDRSHEIGTSVVVTMGDRFEFRANATLSAGYMFTKMYYYKPLYTEYTEEMTPEFWEENKDKLYILDGYYVLNNADYDETKTYYTLEIVEVEITDRDNLIDANFNIQNYYTATNEIVFYIEYGYIELLIDNVSVDADWVLSTSNVAGHDISIAIENLATYTMQKRTADGLKDFAKTDMVTVGDVVVITIQINQNVQNGLTSEYFDLSAGMYLNQIELVSFYVIEDGTENKGKYVIEFLVSEVINEELAKQGKITINYIYKQHEKYVKALTNIYSSKILTNVDVKIDNVEYGYGNSTSYSGDSPEIVQSNKFLAKTKVSYDLGTYNKYFKVNTVKVYHTSQLESNRIHEDELDDYFIKINRNAGLISHVDVRLTDKNIIVIFELQPIINFEGSEFNGSEYQFTRTYSVDDNGNGQAQVITVGSPDDNITKNNDIVSFGFNSSNVRIEYYTTDNTRVNPINVGTYIVKLIFSEHANPEYDWFHLITLPFEIRLVINKLEINLTYQLARENIFVSKQYDSTSNFASFSIVNDGAITRSQDATVEFKGTYVKNKQTRIFTLKYLMLDSDYQKEITHTEGLSGEVSHKNVTAPGSYVNLSLTELKLKNTTYNNNFILNNDTLIIKNYISITPVQITVTGLVIYDKVFDGTTNAKFGCEDEYKGLGLDSVLGEDEVIITPENIIANFNDANIGSRKKVIIDTTNAISGIDRGNYVIGTNGVYEYKDEKSIYPKSLTVEAAGFGIITLENRRGVTDNNLAHLIPIGSELKVQVIRIDTAEYIEIYGSISESIRSGDEFGVGYRLFLEAYGAPMEIDNRLYLTVPTVPGLTTALSLSGATLTNLDYAESGDFVTIDLTQVSDVSCIVLAKKKILLKAWQIVLIVGLSVTAIGGGVATFVIIRRRRANRFNVHDKI